MGSCSLLGSGSLQNLGRTLGSLHLYLQLIWTGSSSTGNSSQKSPETTPIAEGAHLVESVSVLRKHSPSYHIKTSSWERTLSQKEPDNSAMSSLFPNFAPKGWEMEISLD